jgi:hypothetical protein
MLFLKFLGGGCHARGGGGGGGRMLKALLSNRSNGKVRVEFRRAGRDGGGDP